MVGYVTALLEISDREGALTWSGGQRITPALVWEPGKRWRKLGAGSWEEGHQWAGRLTGQDNRSPVGNLSIVSKLLMFLCALLWEAPVVLEKGPQLFGT